MVEIKDLLARFDKIIFSEQAHRETVRKVISEVIGVTIKPEDIKIKNNTVYLNIKPLYKNEIMIKQELIARKLSESLAGKYPKDIR